MTQMPCGCCDSAATIRLSVGGNDESVHWMQSTNRGSGDDFDKFISYEKSGFGFWMCCNLSGTAIYSPRLRDSRRRCQTGGALSVQSNVCRPFRRHYPHKHSY